MKSKRVSQTEIARRLGVSQRTVSKALRDEPDISEKTKQLVKKTAEEMSYHGDKLMRSLLGSGSELVGMILPAFSQYLTGILDNAEKVLRSQGYNLMLIRWTDKEDDSQEINWLLQYKVDGIIVFPRPLPLEKRLLYKRLIKNGEKIVFIDDPSPFSGAGSVASDDDKGMRLAVEHLLSLGHRRIAYVGPLHSYSVSLNARHEAYLKVMKENNLEAFEIQTSVSVKQTIEKIPEFLSNHKNITAYACFNDYTAMTLIEELAKSGQYAPKDYSITGYGDDIRYPNALKVPLTTVSQNNMEIGEKAAKLCLGMIKGDEKPRNIVVPTHLIIRESTQPL